MAKQKRNIQTSEENGKVATPLTPVSPKEDTILGEEFYEDSIPEELGEEIINPTTIDLPSDIVEESKKVDANVRKFIAFNRKGESVKAFNWKIIESKEKVDKNGKPVKTTPMIEFTQIIDGKGILARCVASQMLVTQLTDRAAKGIKVVVITYTHTEKPVNGRSFKNFVVLPKDK